MNKKEIHIIGGGTVFHVRPHLALSAPAYGATARKISELLSDSHHEVLGDSVHLHLTKMAQSSSRLETNEDIARLVDRLIADLKPKIIFMNAALCDYQGQIVGACDVLTPAGKDQPRLKTSEGKQTMTLWPADKVLGRIRKHRKDIFLVAFKTTAGVTPDEQFKAGMGLLKKNSCNLVLANDVQTRNNMILTPELASYGNTTNRHDVLKELVDMALARSSNEFVRTKVLGNEPVSWSKAPKALRDVVEHCVAQGAYKAFNDTTVGHFGHMSKDPIWGNYLDVFLSSRRKQNYNKPGGLDLAQVYFLEDGAVQSQGGKPSAGVRSQFELLKSHNEFDCVIHFHCPKKSESKVPVRPQRNFECGSLNCGRNTTKGVQLFADDQIGAVMLDKHGPNILFKSDGDVQEVIRFIEENFELSEQSR